MTYMNPAAQPLLSDLFMELESGERVPLGHTFTLPPGLPGIGANDNGNRAPDSRVVVRSGDEIATVYSVTVSGLVTATSPTDLMDRLTLLNTQLGQCRKLWRGGRAYLKTHYGLLPQPQMGKGWLSAEVAPIFRLAYLSWQMVDPATGKEIEVFG